MKIKFDKPDASSGKVPVYQIYEDDSRKIIGTVCQVSTERDETPVYISINAQGEELMPPTSDFNEIESRFTEYAKQLNIQEFTQAMMDEADKIQERETSAKVLRENKVREGISR